MDYEFDPNKDAINRGKHKLSLTQAEGFEWDTAVVIEDESESYDERRFRATGYIGVVLHVMAYTWRGENGETCRVMSLRKADPYEVRRYAET